MPTHIQDSYKAIAVAKLLTSVHALSVQLKTSAGLLESECVRIPQAHAYFYGMGA